MKMDAHINEVWLYGFDDETEKSWFGHEQWPGDLSVHAISVEYLRDKWRTMAGPDFLEWLESKYLVEP